jgi:hypothetical protein
MRYSLINVIDSANVGITGITNALTGAFPLSDRRTTRAYAADQDGASGVTITVEPLDGSGSVTTATIALVALVGVTGITSATITLRNASVDQATDTVSVSQPVQQTYLVAAFDDVTADEIEIAFDIGDGESFSIGYLYVGDLSSEITIADGALQYGVESAYPRNLTRAGTPLTSISYLFATVEISTVEMAFSTLRSLVTEIAESGYATPRLWYFDETCILTGEAFWGVFDSDRIQIDPIYYPNGEARATTTLGLTEVF